MKNKLIGLAMLAMSLPIAAESLYDKVKDYLNDFGLPRLEYFMNHRIFFFTDGTFKYRQDYLIDGKPLLADFHPYQPQPISKTAVVANLDNGADLYFYDNRWYEDPSVDGINGNEELWKK